MDIISQKFVTSNLTRVEKLDIFSIWRFKATHLQTLYKPQIRILAPYPNKLSNTLISSLYGANTRSNKKN